MKFAVKNDDETLYLDLHTHSSSLFLFLLSSSSSYLHLCFFSTYIYSFSTFIHTRGATQGISNARLTLNSYVNDSISLPLSQYLEIHTRTHTLFLSLSRYTQEE